MRRALRSPCNLATRRLAQVSGRGVEPLRQTPFRTSATSSGAGLCCAARFRGEVTRLEEARSWEKPTEALTEFDLHLRGHCPLARANPADRDDAMTIWREGLARFPNSTLLRLDVAEAMYRQAKTEPPATAAQTVSSAWALVGRRKPDGLTGRGNAASVALASAPDEGAAYAGCNGGLRRCETGGRTGPPTDSPTIRS